MQNLGNYRIEKLVKKKHDISGLTPCTLTLIDALIKCRTPIGQGVTFTES